MYTYTTLAIIRLFTLALVVLLLGPIQALSPLSPAVAAASAEILGSGPLVQQGYLKAFNTDSNDEFGWSVALDGDTLVVSAFLEAGGTSGVNGDGADNSTQRAGAVYVFVREGALWRQQAYLKASNTDTQDFFGSSVAIDGDTLVVGATVESSRATGVGGDQADNLARGSGAAYVFVRVGGFWRQQAYLKASNTDTEDFFGSSVAIDGDTVVVGSTGEDSGATGANGAGADNSARQSGAAYVFVRTGATWSQQAYLKASNTNAGDLF
ncbi:MAG: integrin, partial [Blastochloris sp.]|nr:integrin [Blastochloris sp.]